MGDQGTEADPFLPLGDWPVQSITIRTWLVGLAMQGLLAHPDLGTETNLKIADIACEQADVILGRLENNK